MAVTVVDNLTLIHAADAGTWVSREVAGCIQTEVFRVEGTQAQGRSCDGPALQGMVSPTVTGFDINNTHIISALATFNQLDTIANGGVRIRVEQGANFGEWFVGDCGVYGERGYQFFGVDGNKPFDRTSGTEPTTTAIDRIGFVFKTITTSGLDGSSMYQDVSRRGSTFTVTGGAAAPRGSVEVAANDVTNARGMFRVLGGVYFILGRMIIGDVTASTNSIFEDTNKVWFFKGSHGVSAAFLVIEFVGGTGTNRATFGSSSGSGVDKEGSGGNTFVSNGAVPFRIEAIDSDITAEFFGCGFLNSVAVRDDAVRNFKVEDNSLTSFTDDTRDANDPGTLDALLFPASDAVNDSANFGHDERFQLLKVNTGTAGVGTYTVTWEYSTAAGFSALTDLTDGTSNFKTTGLQTVSYQIPDDWVKRTVGGASRYWIRARRDAGTSTTNPVMTQCFCSMTGDMRWEHTNAEAIGCTFTNMGTIRIRGSAKFKKNTVVDCANPAKGSAIDLGSADPAADTFRDITVQNCTNGILLQGTGNTTYNFRNIKFVGNTNDVRVDFGTSDTVTINILNGGDTPTISKVDAGTTVTIVNAVIVKVTTKDANDLTVIASVRVLLRADTGGALPANDTVTITRATTTATVAHTAHGLANGDKVEIIKADQPEYNGIQTISNVSANAYDYTVSGTPTTPATGVIKATAIILDGVTDGSGIIQDTGFSFGADQPVEGIARKSTATPFFKSTIIAGTITSGGFDTNAFMIKDE